MTRRQKRSASFQPPRRRPPTRSDDTSALRKFPDDINWFLTGPFAVLLSVGAIFLPPLVGLGWTALLLFEGTIAFLAVALRRRRATRAVLAILSVLILIASGVVWRLQQPTEMEREVDALLESVRTADGWATPPLMFPESRQYVIDNFRAYDPDRVHAWNELPDPKVDNLGDLVLNSGVFAGETVVTAGIIQGGQQVANQLLIQLQPLNHENGRELRKLPIQSLVPGKHERDILLGSTVDSSPESYTILMCLITPRAFVNEASGWYWVVKGTPLAVGRIFRGDGKTSQMTYMLCSSAERFPVES